MCFMKDNLNIKADSYHIFKDLSLLWQRPVLSARGVGTGNGEHLRWGQM